LASIIPDGLLNLKDYCFYTEKKPGYALILYTANVPPGNGKAAGIAGEGNYGESRHPLPAIINNWWWR
jgi:hypothetical protein